MRATVAASSPAAARPTSSIGPIQSPPLAFEQQARQPRDQQRVEPERDGAEAVDLEACGHASTAAAAASSARPSAVVRRDVAPEQPAERGRVIITHRQRQRRAQRPDAGAGVAPQRRAQRTRPAGQRR